MRKHQQLPILQLRKHNSHDYSSLTTASNVNVIIIASQASTQLQGTISGCDAKTEWLTLNIPVDHTFVFVNHIFSVVVLHL